MTPPFIFKLQEGYLTIKKIKNLDSIENFLFKIIKLIILQPHLHVMCLLHFSKHFYLILGIYGAKIDSTVE